MAKLAYAQWPWGTSKKEEFIQSCEELSSLGYRYFESIRTFVDVFMGDVREFMALTEKYDFHPVSFYFHLTGNMEDDVNELKSKIGFVQACGIQTICVQGPYPRAEPADEALRVTLDTVAAYGKICREYGVMPSVHPHANTSVMYGDETDFIMQNTDPALVGFAPDTAHLKVGGMDPVAVCEKYRDRITFTHIKDVKGELKSSGVAGATGTSGGVEVYSNFLELGEGNVDLDGVFRVLKSVNYHGYLCVELDAAPSTNIQSAKKNMEYMKAHWGAFEE